MSQRPYFVSEHRITQLSAVAVGRIVRCGLKFVNLDEVHRCKQFPVDIARALCL